MSTQNRLLDLDPSKSLAPSGHRQLHGHIRNVGCSNITAGCHAILAPAAMQIWPQLPCHSATSCHSSTSCHAFWHQLPCQEPLQSRPPWSHCSPGPPGATAAQAPLEPLQARPPWSHCSPGPPRATAVQTPLEPLQPGPPGATAVKAALETAATDRVSTTPARAQ